MNILVWIIMGALAGWIASLVMGTDAQQGAVMNIVIGIVGSFIAGIIVTLLTKGNADFVSTISGFNLRSLLFSTLGAIVLIALMRMFRGKTIS